MESKKICQSRRPVWRKLHLAVGANTHEVICADLSLNKVPYAEIFTGITRQIHRKIKAVVGDETYDIRLRYREQQRKKMVLLFLFGKEHFAGLLSR
ncbi:hypothetical protein NB704_004343 [Pantoea ananatis]|nr:hypothetical protein [Pantoea ananatis]